MSREPIWVAIANGTVRHQVGSWHHGDDEIVPKQVLCRHRPISVHLCTPEEMENLRPCYACRKVGWDDDMINRIIKEI